MMIFKLCKTSGGGPRNVWKKNTVISCSVLRNALYWKVVYMEYKIFIWQIIIKANTNIVHWVKSLLRWMSVAASGSSCFKLIIILFANCQTLWLIYHIPVRRLERVQNFQLLILCPLRIYKTCMKPIVSCIKQICFAYSTISQFLSLNRYNTHWHRTSGMRYVYSLSGLW